MNTPCLASRRTVFAAGLLLAFWLDASSALAADKTKAPKNKEKNNALSDQFFASPEVPRLRIEISEKELTKLLKHAPSMAQHG